MKNLRIPSCHKITTEPLPGEKRDELVAVPREGVLHSLPQTGSSVEYIRKWAWYWKWQKLGEALEKRDRTKRKECVREKGRGRHWKRQVIREKEKEKEECRNMHCCLHLARRRKRWLHALVAPQHRILLFLTLLI